MPHDNEVILHGSHRYGHSCTGWLGTTPEDARRRAAQIQDGTLHMLVVFGTWEALRFWRRCWDTQLAALGAVVTLADGVTYKWPSGAWLRLRVATTTDTTPIRGTTFTDYEIDASVRAENGAAWREVLALLRRKVTV